MKKGSGMRQLLAVLLAVWMAAAGALGAAAQEEKKQVAMSFTARSALLMEQQTGKVLFSQNETQRVDVYKRQVFSVLTWDGPSYR